MIDQVHSSTYVTHLGAALIPFVYLLNHLVDAAGKVRISIVIFHAACLELKGNILLKTQSSRLESFKKNDLDVQKSSSTLCFTS